ncbi:hypothetical protein SDC9_184782 [bioreactor metagenome]|uniref:Uncharacterized protein n=1 Tax=bioreactor metagenome TaxID=1076179 RepID=A0A645HFC0_9ZZZZ
MVQVFIQDEGGAGFVFQGVFPKDEVFRRDLVIPSSLKEERGTFHIFDETQGIISEQVVPIGRLNGLPEKQPCFFSIGKHCLQFVRKFFFPGFGQAVAVVQQVMGLGAVQVGHFPGGRGHEDVAGGQRGPLGDARNQHSSETVSE